MSKHEKDTRARNWWFLVYPDSAPENWKEMLRNVHTPCAISPLHDKDVNKDGSPKKAHWHVILRFTGKKSYSQIKGITDSLNSPIPEVVGEIRDATRYLAHLDDPDKYPYNIDDIETFGGYDLSVAFKPTADEREQYISEMCDWVDDNNVTEFTVLVRYAKLEHRHTWFSVLSKSATYFMTKYIASSRHGRKVTVNEETGEVS